MVTIYNTTLSATSQRHFSDGLGGGSYYKGAGPTFLVSSAKKIGKCAMFLRSMSLFHYFCKNLIVCQFPRML